MGETTRRDVWKSAVITNGGQYATMGGISETLLWPVHNQRTQIVSIFIECFQYRWNLSIDTKINSKDSLKKNSFENKLLQLLI